MPPLWPSPSSGIGKKAGATSALGLIADKNVFVAAKHEGGAAYMLTMRLGHRFP